jgi:hypothetical protein
MENETKTTTETTAPKEPFELVREAREKLKAENDALEAEKFRAEKLRAEQIIGGRSLMTSGTMELSPEEKIKQESKEFWKGTIIEKALEKHG